MQCSKNLVIGENALAASSLSRSAGEGWGEGGRTKFWSNMADQGQHSVSGQLSLACLCKVCFEALPPSPWPSPALREREPRSLTSSR